ncbi:hypothetical protein RN001_011961 [Aquatica leii]|uniref:Uncharacterized protein n=1 Tax=Aquatica leii TaxID=1421715 RepID=A0AAN7PSF4_9COLE|nr:hypothetical protein RN001_011961 [Aquatica leii]
MIAKVPEEIEILKFPCHTQAVERCIKLVTEASSLVCGAEARDEIFLPNVQLLTKVMSLGHIGNQNIKFTIVNEDLKIKTHEGRLDVALR